MAGALDKIRAAPKPTAVMKSHSKISEDPQKPKRRRIRTWLSSWVTEVTDNGEMIQAWCVRLAKEPGMVFCKYCKLKVNFTNKGLSAMRSHANTRKHIDNCKLYHRAGGRAQTGLPVNHKSKTTKKKPTSTSSQKSLTYGNLSKSITAVARGGQNAVRLKAGKIKSDLLIKARLNHQHHLKHTIHPSTSIKLSHSHFSPTLNPKFSVPILSKKFLQLKTKPSKNPSSSPFALKLKSKLSSSPHSFPLASASSSQKPRPRPAIPRLPFQKTPSPLVTSSGTSLHYRPQTNLSGHPTTKFYSPPSKRSLSQFPSKPPASDLHSPSRSSPTPALSLGLGHLLKSHANLNQVYSGAHLGATGPPYLHPTAQSNIQLVPVFICYFCHEEFPSKSSLYEHREQCAVKLGTGSSNNENNCNTISITANNNSNDVSLATVDIIKSSASAATLTASLSSSTSSVMDSTTVTASTMMKSSKPTTPIKDVVIRINRLPPLNNPDNAKQSDSVFFPSTHSPQKLCTPLTSSPLSQPQSSSSSSSFTTTSWSYINNNISKPAFLNGLQLLPIKTALQEQKRISRKRRNTECESLDWVEDEDIPPTPKTPCTPPTPKLLISHLSREEYRRELPPHRLFRLSSSTSEVGNDTKECDKDLMNVGNGESSSKLSSHSQNSYGGSGNDDSDNKQEGKISVVRSLYNVDVTSPLGQFVIRHYKGDPSLHILSDIESHCLTSPSATTKTTNFSLRARNLVYPITFGCSGRRLLYHDFYHSYKFNKSQVKDFMKTVNTGLNKDSRRLSRQMRKCRIALKRISKSDLRYWISSQNNITVDLKMLSPAEIAQWTSPKLTSSSNSSDSSDDESIFPEGLKSFSPDAKSILGLKNKKEVRIKTVNTLSPSILNITNYVSEETCADLLINRKTIYSSLLFDWTEHNSENMDASVTNVAKCNNTPPQQIKKQDNVILRRMLSQRPVLGSSLAGNTLPDITNLSVDRQNLVAAVGVANILPKLNQVKHSPNIKSKTTIGIVSEKSEVIMSKIRTSRRRNRIGIRDDCKNVLTNITDEASVSNINLNVNKTASEPFVSSEIKKSVKDEKLDLDEVDSCVSFVNPPNPCDLLRETTPSQNSSKSRQSSPEEPYATPSTISHTPTSFSSTPIRRRQSNRLRQGPKWSGSRDIEFQPPTEVVQEILSIEDNPGLLNHFLDHFRCMHEEVNEPYRNDISKDSRSKVKYAPGANDGAFSVNIRSNVKRRSDRKCQTESKSPVSRKRESISDGRKLEALKSFLEGQLKTDDEGRKDIDKDIVKLETKDNADVGVEGEGNSHRTRQGGDKQKASSNIFPVSINGDDGDSEGTLTSTPRLSRLAERSHAFMNITPSDSNSHLQQRRNNSNLRARAAIIKRRKSSPRVTGRTKKIGLNRRLSAAGLVKREEGSIGSKSPVSSSSVTSRSPVVSSISEVWRSPESSASRSPVSSSALLESPLMSMSQSSTSCLSGGGSNKTTAAIPTSLQSLNLSFSDDNSTVVGENDIDDNYAAINNASTSNAGGFDFRTKKENGNKNPPTSPPITLVIRNRNVQGRRQVETREGTQNVKVNSLIDRDGVCDLDTNTTSRKGRRETPRPSNNPSSSTLRMRKCLSESRASPPELGTSGGKKADIEEGANAAASMSMTRSRSWVSASNTRRGGLPKRKCLVSSQSTSSSSPSGSATAEKVSRAAMATAPKVTSVYNKNASNNVRLVDGGQEHHKPPPPSSSAASMSKGGLLKFISSFKMV